MSDLVLQLTAVTPCKGIYDIKGVSFKSIRKDMLFLEPEAAQAFTALAPYVVVSDMFRSPESSLKRRQTDPNAQPPGFSAHNMGLAIDVDVKASMKNLGVKTKAAFDAELEQHGWFCHRLDRKEGKEWWHFNYLGIGAKPGGSFTSDDIEAKIQQLYGAGLSPDDRACQRHLAALKFYSSTIDGIIGERTRSAVRAFQRQWGLSSDGILGTKTRRTLAYVSAATARLA